MSKQQYWGILPPPNSRARSGTVSLAIVHRQADKHCSLTRELKVPPIRCVAGGHLPCVACDKSRKSSSAICKQGNGILANAIYLYASGCL